MYVSGYGKSPYGVEWTRYEADAPYPTLVKTIAHVAFEVEIWPRRSAART